MNDLKIVALSYSAETDDELDFLIDFVSSRIRSGASLAQIEDDLADELGTEEVQVFSSGDHEITVAAAINAEHC